MDIEGKVSISFDKSTKIETITTSIYLNNVLDTEVYVNTDIHPEGSIKDGLNAYNYRLNKLIEKYEKLDT